MKYQIKLKASIEKDLRKNWKIRGHENRVEYILNIRHRKEVYRNIA